MVRIGKPSTLEIVKFVEAGAYLDGGPYGEILLPNRYITHGHKVGDDVEVFISFDSEDRIVATTDFPYAMVDEFAYMQVVDVTNVGAFLDWGLPKNLLVPFREQRMKMEMGKAYIVYVYVDKKTGRIAATAKYNKFLNIDEIDFQNGDEVDLLIAERTELGYKAIINGTHLGILYANEVFKPISTGDKLKGFVKKIREDGKIDLSLEKQGYDKVDPVTVNIIAKLNQNNGFLPITDSSDPDVIQKVLGISKKTFKKAIGALYKSRQITIEESGIRLK
jgi:uncharacterized protein